MAKLVLSSAGTVVQQRFLDDERVTVGREANNEIVVDDPTVSREHAAIFAVGNDYILEDLNSTHGTTVNGHAVRRRILQHGDVIELGSFHLRYVDTKSTDVDLDRTMLIAGLMAPAASNAVDAATNDAVHTSRKPRANFPKGRIRWMQGPRGGETRDLDRVIATFGTPGEQVAVVTRRPHGYFISHVEGRGTARVNGKEIGADAQPLRQGDVVEVGADKFEFQLK